MDDLSERRHRVLELAASGVPYRTIEEQTGENRGTISRWVRRDMAAFEAARSLGDDDLGELGDLVEGLEGDPLGRARTIVARQTVTMLHRLLASAATPLKERLAAAHELRAWIEPAPSAEDIIPPLPTVPPAGPAPLPCGSCAECVACPGARWAAWVERVVWARRQPLATDRAAVQAGGALVSEEAAADWLEQGGADIAEGRPGTPAAVFAGRFAAAAGDALSKLLAEHAEALTRGDARTAQVAHRALEVLLPKEYTQPPDPLARQKAEEPIARILRIADERRRR